MGKFTQIVIFVVLLAGYLISVFYLNDVEILAGNVTPVMNYWVLSLFAATGVIVGFLLVKKSTVTVLIGRGADSKVKQHAIYFLIAILIFFKLFSFLLSPQYIQFLPVWPDSLKYLSDMHAVLNNSASLFDRKSPIYTLWLLFNHLTFGRLINPNLTSIYFGVEVYWRDILPPLILQNIIGIISAWICYSIFSRISARFALVVTLFTFLNPTSLFIDSTILRESLSLFFIMSGFALLLKAKREEMPVFAFVSGILFVFAYQARFELIAIYIMLFIVLLVFTVGQRQNKWWFNIVFIFPLVLSVAYFEYLSSRENISRYPGESKFSLALQGLKTKCYSYESRAFPELIKAIQLKASQCENERFASCDNPAPTEFIFKTFLDEEIDKYNHPLIIKKLETRTLDQAIFDEYNLKPDISHKYNPDMAIVDLKRGVLDKEFLFFVYQFWRREVLDRIFWDVVGNNISCYTQSSLINMGYNLSHHVHNMVPIFYDGDNDFIAKNWNYFVSPKMLELYEKDGYAQKLVVLFFRAIDLHNVRKILFPFFFVGTFVVLNEIMRKKLDFEGNVFLVSVVLVISWGHLLFLSSMGNAVARYIYSIFPFLFAMEFIGVVGVYCWLQEAFKSSASIFYVALSKRWWKFIVIFAVLLIALFMNIGKFSDYRELSSAYAVWDMEVVSGSIFTDLKKGYNATGFNVGIVKGHSGKAAYFSGNASHIQTDVDFYGWKKLKISFWIKPEKKEGDDLSVVLDNGHDAQSNFTIQSADTSGKKWLWHCNGADIFFDLTLDQWSHVVVIADTENGLISASVDGKPATWVNLSKKFQFGSTPLAIGKLAKQDTRFFKGSIDEVMIWKIF